MKYHISIRILHWMIAMIVIGLLISGLTVDDWPKEWKPQFYYWHKSFGMVILLLAMLRVNYRLRHSAPPLPNKFTKIEMILSKISHLALYFFMFAMPISGYVMSMAGSRGVLFFGYPLPDLIGPNEQLGELAYKAHEILAYIFIGLIALHILAVIKHFVIDKENILKRMV